MRRQDFERIRNELLPLVEETVVLEHRALHEQALGEPWSPPAAYRWIRYEDPDPCGRLLGASSRLGGEWGRLGARPEALAALARLAPAIEPVLDRAERIAAELGYRR